MSKNIRTRDGARHFVRKITLPKASDVTPLPPEKKICGSRRFEKMVKKSLGGGGRSPVAAPLVVAMARRWRHCANLTGLEIEPHTSRTDSVRLATELIGFNNDYVMLGRLVILQ